MPVSSTGRRPVLKALGGIVGLSTAGTAAADGSGSQVNATIRSFAVDGGSYTSGETVTATVDVENTGETTHTFFVGFSVRDSESNYYDNGGTTGESVEIAPGGVATVEVSWTVEDGASADTYDALTRVWEESGPPSGHLDESWAMDAFSVTTDDDSGTDAALSGEAMYVWAGVEDIVTGDPDAFVDEMNRYGVERAFLSWGALSESVRDPDDGTLSSFVDACESDGVAVSLLWGERLGVEGVQSALADVDRMVAHSPSGIHYDLEPKGAQERDVYLSGFLDFYETLLTHGQFGDTDVSVYVNPYWYEVAGQWAKPVAEHESVDRIVIAAYRDSVAEIRDRIEIVRDAGTSKPYYAAVELQSPENPVVTEDITLWDEADDAPGIIDDVASDPPDESAFLGMGLHCYDPVTSGHY